MVVGMLVAVLLSLHSLVSFILRLVGQQRNTVRDPENRGVRSPGLREGGEPFVQPPSDHDEEGCATEIDDLARGNIEGRWRGPLGQQHLDTGYVSDNLLDQIPQWENGDRHEGTCVRFVVIPFSFTTKEENG
jgi:hypothetical protein